MTTWISLYPQWFISEQKTLARSYPNFRLDEGLLLKGILCYYGELVVRPSGGAKRFPVQLVFPDVTPFGFPVVTPIEKLPDFDDDGAVTETLKVMYFDRRHQMPRGGLCLFQHETRGSEGGESIRAVDVLKRAESWLIGHLTGRWPPDSHESELEAHFYYAGDVLLSKTFYDPEISGSGRFYMARDMRRLVDAVDMADPPFVVTVLSRMSEGVEVLHDARSELINVFPWLGNEAWSPEQIVEFEDRQNNDAYWALVTDHGFWWSLPNEPSPFRDGAGLLRELASAAPRRDAWNMVSAAMGGDLASRSKHFFGLRYPGRHGREEWLVLRLETPKKQKTPGGGLVLSNITEAAKKAEFEKGIASCFLAHGARPDELQLRNSTVVQETVRDTTVALIGLGALGSKVAELLAQAGVGAFHLCDGDILTTGNVARHVGGLSDFGARKTRVVMTRLHNINPHLKDTVVWDGQATESVAKLRAFIKNVDLVVCTTADENAESAINQVAVIEGTPVVYGRAMRRGSMGRVFLVRPGLDACKTCIGVYADTKRNGDKAPDDWIAVSEREEDELLHECGRPVIPASAIDLAFVASLVARCSLDFLENRTNATNHWIWSKASAIDLDPRLDRSFCTFEGTLPKLAECPSCQVPEVVCVEISEAVREGICREVEASPGAETGGILLGYIENTCAVVVRATGPGPKAKRNPRRFERDVDFIQSELERAARELDERGLYIGEWHSHLEREPEPSGRDILSLSGISESPNYATRCPVMLIAGFDTDQGTVSELRTWSFPISRPVYPVELTVKSDDVPSP